jgi:hypothetical protein
MRVLYAAVIPLTLLLPTGCSDRVRTLTIPPGVTRIDVHAGYDGPMIKRIDSSADTQRVLAFLAKHRKHWEYSDSGFATPSLEIYFYRGDERLGRFGASCDGGTWFFESELTSKDRFTLRGIRASDEDVRAFIALIGMADYPLKTEGCS